MTMNTHRSLARVPITPYALPSSECLAYNKITWPLSADRAVLLIHDMQNYWIDLYEDKATIVNPVMRLLKLFREARLPVVYCRGERAQTRFERGLGLTVWGDGLNAEHVTEHDCAIADAVAPDAESYVIEKSRHSAFFKTPLEELLRKMNRDQVVVCGVFAHHGVMVSTIDGYMRNFQMTLVADALGDYSEDEHRFALKYVAQMCGSISTVEEINSVLFSKAA